MIFLNGKQIAVKTFPNGESFIDIDNLELVDVNEVKLKYENDLDITHLVFLKGYLDDMGKRARLIIGYLPYSRMDRTEGKRIFTLKYFCKLINNLNFESVEIYEPHSDVGVALIDRVKVVNMSAIIGTELLIRLSSYSKPVYIVYPDAGAAKRYSNQVNHDKILTANKERDFVTGDIKSIELSGHIQGEYDAIIIDDLCSKGGTFALTAEKLKSTGAQDIYLVVTHCEDTIIEGKLLKTDLVKEIYTTNTILTKEDPKLVIKKVI